jgi:hypothetical protein
MHSIAAHPKYFLLALIATPFIAFAAYIAWLVVPVVIAAVVPEVVQAVTTSSN